MLLSATAITLNQSATENVVRDRVKLHQRYTHMRSVDLSEATSMTKNDVWATVIQSLIPSIFFTQSRCKLYATWIHSYWSPLSHFLQEIVLVDVVMKVTDLMIFSMTVYHCKTSSALL